ncbi:MAG TPA: MFS transporter [Vicinamibacterales bacterium]|jgi:MFS family permease|nr:MFS transporter [Vicinamibacterales bacterium]
MTRLRDAGLVSSSSAFRFVLTMGLVNLFADMTYEGGASINGQFLGSMGASAAAISIIAGLGEFFGYALRSVSGYLADRTGKYWPITFAGYAINLLAVPAMALATSWQAAGALVLAERIGRAFRKPTVEAMLSYSTGKHGRGWVYAVNTAMDETGATLGPLLIALVLFLKRDFRSGYTVLLIAALLALASLVAARVLFPVPSRLEAGGPSTASAEGFTRAYWLYMAAGGCFAAGLMSFELVSYHLSSTGTVTAHWVPIFLALSTAGAVVASLILGKSYDKLGISVVVVAVILSACFSPLVFFGSFWPALAGLMLWGIGYATQDTLLKVLIASELPEGQRNLAFGVFYLGYGGGWLLGSITTGLLYDRSRLALVVFAVIVQLVSIPLFVAGSRRARGEY